MPRTLVVSLWIVLVTVLGAGTEARGAANPFNLQASFSGASDAFFGYSVALDGDVAVVGAINDSAGKGAAYVFVRSGATWSQEQVLTASDGVAGDEFGYAVAVNLNIAMVASVNKSSGQGAVYVFTRSGTLWTQQQELTASDGAALDCFGCSIALSGTTVVIGAPGRMSGTGAAYAFASQGGAWQQQKEFLGQSTGEAFGFSVAFTADSTTAVIGAYAANAEAGHAYVWTRTGTTWSQEAVLAASDGQAHDRFGYSVAVRGNTALVGAYANAGKGAVYVFNRTGHVWSQPAVQPKLLASDGAANDVFGYSLSFNVNIAVVGAYEKSGPFGPGAAYVFTRSGDTWAQQKLLASAPGQSFGYSVATSGGSAVVGAFGASNDSGAAYAFVDPPPPVPALGDKVGLLGLALLVTAFGFGAGRPPVRGEQPS